MTFGAAVGTGGRESSEIAKKGEVNLQVRLQLLGRLACDAALVRACEGREAREAALATAGKPQEPL